MLYSWQKHTKYYNLCLQPNLFGSIDIICSWGSLKSKRGGCKIISLASPHTLQKTINNIVKRRQYRGYSIVCQPN